MLDNYLFLEVKLCARLKELGVKKRTYFYWILPDGSGNHKLASVFQPDENGSVVLKEYTDIFSLAENEYPAWTAEELIGIMPKRLTIDNKPYCALFIEKNEWEGHNNAYMCYYLTNSFGVVAKKGSNKLTEKRILAKIMVESEGRTLVEAIAKLLIRIIELGLITADNKKTHFN